MKKRLFISLVLGLLLIGSVYYVSFDKDDVVEPVESVEPYKQKEIIYAPIECFLNETHYDDKCVEDYIDGN